MEVTTVVKQLFSDDGILLYEGETLFDKPYGTGKVFYPDGKIYQEGKFRIKGLVKGKEYYPSGVLRFDGEYAINNAYGPNYPIIGKCYNEDGEEYFDGRIHVKKTGLGYPIVERPAEFGSLAYKVDICYFSFNDKKKLLSGDVG